MKLDLDAFGVLWLQRHEEGDWERLGHLEDVQWLAVPEALWPALEAIEREHALAGEEHRRCREETGANYYRGLR